jgi:cell cycle sensor histidine kinase DivJ
MGRLFSFRASKETSTATAGSAVRPDAMRRAALADNALVLILLAALAMPLAVYMLVALREGLALTVAGIFLVGGMASLSLNRTRQFAEAAGAQVATIIVAGGVLAVADRYIADFGIATAVLGPVLASLLGDAKLRQRSWAAFALAAVTSIALSGAGLSIGIDPAARPGLVAFAAAAILVAMTANRINRAYEVYEKAQVSAYRHLVEHMQDGIMRFSEDGELLYASPSCETLFGCRRYELGEGSLGGRVHVADRPAYMTAFADANRGGTARTIEVRMRRDRPAEPSQVPLYLWVEIGFSPIPEPGRNDGPYEIVALLRDISDRKDQEQQAREARKAAEQASVAKSRFLATIGHELRTPLNAVVGFSEMMTQGIGGEPNPTHREYAALIHQSGKHLLEVVGMLLDMSRIEAGKFELQTDTFAPEGLIEPSLRIVEALARERGTTLKSDISRPLPGIVADERACRQILINLLSNAIKFSHPGTQVIVSMKRQGQDLNISVSDRGIGMDASAVARIGEPFFQANDGLDRRHEGTGLGLSIVKGLVDLHGGTLRAVSEIGVGTTVTVLLPLNGPAIKVAETAPVTTLHRESPPAHTTPWQDEKRKAL